MNAYKANLMQSILPEWNLFYVDFDYLEELINIRRNSQKNKAAHEEKIANEVESQLLKVNTYFHHIISELESKINNFQVNLNSNVNFSSFFYFFLHTNNSFLNRQLVKVKIVESMFNLR